MTVAPSTVRSRMLREGAYTYADAIEITEENIADLSEKTG